MCRKSYYDNRNTSDSYPVLNTTSDSERRRIGHVARTKIERANRAGARDLYCVY